MQIDPIDEDLDGYDAWRCTGDTTRLSYTVEVGAPQTPDGEPVAERGSVLLMHELTGLDEHTVRLARSLRERGYRVWMPVFFGVPGEGVGAAAAIRQLCVRAELRSLATHGRTPLSAWLAELVDEIVADRTRSGGPSGVTAVGMCLTGGLVLPMVLRADPTVTAAVTAQQSAPVRPGVGDLAPGAANLGLTAEQRSRAATSEVPVLAMSFARDPLCPARRRRAVRRLLGRGQPQQLPGGGSTVVTQLGPLRRVEASGAGHATLTAHAHRADHETVAALLAFLDDHHPPA